MLEDDNTLERERGYMLLLEILSVSEARDGTFSVEGNEGG